MAPARHIPRRDRRIAVSILTTTKSADVIAMLEADGWQLKRIKGSHYHFSHPTKPGLVTVPHPKRDIPQSTLHSIRR